MARIRWWAAPTRRVLPDGRLRGGGQPAAGRHGDPARRHDRVAGAAPAAWSPRSSRCCAGAAAPGSAGRARPTRRPSRSRTTASHLHPVALSARGGRGLLRGLLQRHAVAALPRRRGAAGVPPRSGGRPTSQVNRAVRRRRRRGGRRGRDRLGAGLPAAAGARRCCASCGPTCGSGSSCTSRSRRPSCSCSCRGAADPRGPARRRPGRLPDARRRRATSAPLATRLADATGRAAASCATTAAPCRSARSRSRSTPARSTSSPARPRSQERAKEIRAELGDPAQVLLGVDRLDYTKGIDVRLRAFEELLARTASTVDDTVMVQVATPSRERVEHYQRLRGRDRAGGRPDQRRRTAGSGTRRCTTCTSRYPREELAALLPRRRRHARHAAARRHEPGRQGVRRLPVRPRRRAGALRVHRRRRRAEGGAAGQPARHRRAEGGHRRRVRPCRAEESRSGCAPCAARCSPTTSTAGPARSSTRSASRNDRAARGGAGAARRAGLRRHPRAHRRGARRRPGPARRARGDPGARRAAGNDRGAGVRAGAGRPGRGLRARAAGAAGRQPRPRTRRRPRPPRRRVSAHGSIGSTPRWTRWSTAPPGCAPSASPPGWRCTCAAPIPRSAPACWTRCAVARRPHRGSSSRRARRCWTSPSPT